MSIERQLFVPLLSAVFLFLTLFWWVKICNSEKEGVRKMGRVLYYPVLEICYDSMGSSMGSDSIEWAFCFIYLIYID